MDKSAPRAHPDPRRIYLRAPSSPVHVLIIAIASVFIAEVVVMFLLSAVTPGRNIALLDSLLLVVLVFPALYFLILKPQITERKRTEHSLAQSNELIDRLFSIGQVMLAYVDTRFNFVRVNAKYCEGVDRAADSLLGKNHFELFPDAETEEIFRNVRETGAPYFAHAKPWKFSTRPGAARLLDWSLLPIFDAAGVIEGLILVWVDVTEHRQAEMALIQNETLLRRVLETLPVGVWVLDRNGCILKANPASIEIWGGVRCRCIDDFGRYRGTWLESGEAVDSRGWSAARALLKGETCLDEEMEIEGIDGTRKIILNSAVPLNAEGGDVIGAIVVSQDITEFKRAEQEIRERNRQLSTLYEISSQTSRSVAAPQIQPSLKDLFVKEAGFSAGRIFTYDQGRSELKVELSWGHENGIWPVGTRLPLDSHPFRDLLFEKKVRALTSAQLQKGGTVCAGFLPGADSCVFVPLVGHGQIQGLMEVTNDGEVGDEDRQRLSYFQAIGRIMGISIHNSRLFGAEQKARRTAEVLREAGLALTQTLDMSTVMEALLDFAERVVPFDNASVILVEDEQHLAVHAARGCECEQPLQRGDRISFERGQNNAIEQMIAGRRGKIVPTLAKDMPGCLSPCHAAMQSWLGVPFVAQENVVGLLALGKLEAGFYQDDHLKLAEALASQAAVAVQNSWLFGQLRASRLRLQTLSRQLVEVQENERGYIARELHDQAGQVLTSLMLGLRLLERDANDPQAVVGGIGKLKGMVDEVLDDLHRLAMDLRPASLDHLGLDAGLRQQLETITERNGIAAQMETVGMDVRLPKEIELAVYRIVQEALANVVRHAQATRVDVLLERRDGKVVAVIEDNGVGFDERVALDSGRMGLFGMRERAEMLGGSLTVERGTTGGTTVLVEVPYANSNPDCR